MARDLDIILFGATGFTGKHAIPLVAKYAKAKGRHLSWGIAGRSEDKLKNVLAEYKDKIESPDKVPLIIADVADDESLKTMARKARVIINCCGPYRFYGEQVVKACIEEGTHHVDVSGEPEYMEKMQLKYHKAAEEKGVYVLSACGLDSIPSDLGLIFLQSKFEGVLNSVETYLKTWSVASSTSGPVINYGTWDSAVNSLANAHELKSLRKRLFPNRLPPFRPRLKPTTKPHKNDIVSGWILPFPGSDKSVMRRSQRCFYEQEKKRPVQVETYFVVKSLLHVIGMAVFGVFFTLLTKFEFGRNLLLNYPSIFSFGMFSKEPPREEMIEASRFSVTLYGKGWKDPLPEGSDQYVTSPDSAICGIVKGSNPGYGATNDCLVLSGVKVITETDKLPGKGGVFPPGYALAKTSLVEELNENGVTFEILYEKKLG